MKVFKLKPTYLFLLSTISLAPQLSNANDGSIWLGFSQSSSDYFTNTNSQIKPQGNNIGFSHQIADNFNFGLSYAKLEADAQWSFTSLDNRSFVNAAKTESKLSSLYFSWQKSDFSLIFSATKVSNDEKSLEHPSQNSDRVLESFKGKDNFYNLSLNQINSFDSWMLGWGVGLQHSDNKSRSLQAVIADINYLVDTRNEQSSLSTILELTIALNIEQDNFFWSPQLSLSWNQEIEHHGEGNVTINRNRQHQLNSIQTPDSGFIDLSFNFYWNDHWSNSLSLARSFSAEEELTSLSFDLSYDF